MVFRSCSSFDPANHPIMPFERWLGKSWSGTAQGPWFFNAVRIPWLEIALDASTFPWRVFSPSPLYYHLVALSHGNLSHGNLLRNDFRSRSMCGVCQEIQCSPDDFGRRWLHHSKCVPLLGLRNLGGCRSRNSWRWAFLLHLFVISFSPFSFLVPIHDRNPLQWLFWVLRTRFPPQCVSDQHGEHEHEGLPGEIHVGLRHYPPSPLLLSEFLSSFLPSHRAKIIDGLRDIQFAPSVQMQGNIFSSLLFVLLLNHVSFPFHFSSLQISFLISSSLLPMKMRLSNQMRDSAVSFHSFFHFSILHCILIPVPSFGLSEALKDKKMGSEEDSDSEYEDNPSRPHQHDHSKADSQPPSKKKSTRGSAAPSSSQHPEGEEKALPIPPPTFNAELFHQTGMVPLLSPQKNQPSWCWFLSSITNWTEFSPVCRFPAPRTQCELVCALIHFHVHLPVHSGQCSPEIWLILIWKMLLHLDGSEWWGHLFNAVM